MNNMMENMGSEKHQESAGVEKNLMNLMKVSRTQISSGCHGDWSVGSRTDDDKRKSHHFQVQNSVQRRRKR